MKTKDPNTFEYPVRHTPGPRSLTTTALLLILLSALLPSCYHYRISAPNNLPSTETESEVVHGLLWGLAVKPKNGLKPKNCEPHDMALYQVQVTSNLGYSLITVVTLGIWSPMKVEWQCAKPCPGEGEIR